MTGVEITKGQVGASIIGAADSTSGLIASAIANAGKLEYGEVYLIANAKMAEDLGVTEEYDTTNKVRLYHHISEFFRMAGDGTKLYLMIVEQSKTRRDMLTSQVKN